jgi:hypothetical protein
MTLYPHTGERIGLTLSEDLEELARLRKRVARIEAAETLLRAARAVADFWIADANEGCVEDTDLSTDLVSARRAELGAE